MDEPILKPIADKEGLVFTVNMYKEQAQRVLKNIRAIDTRMGKLSAKKDELNKEYAKLNELITNVSGESLPAVFDSETAKNEPTVMVEAASPAITQTAIDTEQTEEAIKIKKEGLQLFAYKPKEDISDYNPYWQWEDRISYILQYAPKALKRNDIPMYLRGLDKTFEWEETQDIMKKLAPYLSRMVGSQKILMGSAGESGVRGNYYFHPSWFENGIVKEEYKDRVPLGIKV